MACHVLGLKGARTPDTAPFVACLATRSTQLNRHETLRHRIVASAATLAQHLPPFTGQHCGTPLPVVRLPFAATSTQTMTGAAVARLIVATSWTTVAGFASDGPWSSIATLDPAGTCQQA